MHKQAQISAILHLSIPNAGSMQTLNVCVRPNDDLGAVHVNLDCFQVIFDPDLQLIRGISTTCLVLVQKLLLELDRIKLLAQDPCKAVSCKSQEEAAHNIVIGIGINQHQRKPSTILQTLDWSSAKVCFSRWEIVTVKVSSSATRSWSLRRPTRSLSRSKAVCLHSVRAFSKLSMSSYHHAW